MNRLTKGWDFISGKLIEVEFLSKEGIFPASMDILTATIDGAF